MRPTAEPERAVSRGPRHAAGSATRPPQRGQAARVLVRTTGLGIRRRAVAFLGLLILAAGAVVVAVAGPLLLRAAQQSSLAAATGPSTLAAVLTYSSDVFSQETIGQFQLGPRSLWRTAHRVDTTTSTYSWQRIGSGATGGQAATGHLVASDRCTGVRIASGRCPRTVTEVAVSSGSGIPIGAQIRLADLGRSPFTVVGRYEPAAGGPFTDPLMAAAARTTDRDRGGDLLVERSSVTQVQDGTWVTVFGIGPAHPLRLEDLATVRSSLASARTALQKAGTARITTPIDQVLAEQRATADAASIVSLALAAQTLAVAWAAQALLVGGIARGRAGEWGVARLRGFRPGPRLVARFAEPVIAIVLGSLAGYAVVAAAAAGIAAATAGTSVQPLEALPLAIGALAAIGSLVALGLASARSASMPLAQLLRERAESRRIGRLALVAQSGAVLATALVVYSALTGGLVTGPQLPLLAPALVAVTAGVIALRVAVPLLRRRLRPIPGSLTGLLVGRRVIRTPSLLATAVVLCTAVALATAAAQTMLTADRLQHLRAEAVVGAARVLEVRPALGTDLVAAVRRADPSGRLAMAAVDVADGAGPQRVVAVDTARLATVSSWQSDWGGMPTARLRTLLAPALSPSLQLTGQRVEVDLANVAIHTDPSGVYSTKVPDLQLSLTVQDAQGFQTLVLGRLSSTRFVRSLPCSGGCRVVGFGIANRGEGTGPWGVGLDIAGLSTDAESAADTAALLRPGLWRQQLGLSTPLDEAPRIRIAQADRGLALSIDTIESSADLGIVPRDTPQPVPVLTGPDVRLSAVGGVRDAFLGDGLGFDPILVRPVGRALILPRALGDGVLADLGVMEKVTDPAALRGRQQVWLSAAAGPSVVTALQREGLRVIGDQRQSDVESGFLALTVPRVALQGAAIGATGLLLALVALLVSRLLRRPAMRATAEVLRAAGASERTARRIAFTEAAAPAAGGAVFGAVAGVAGALLVLPSLPLGAGEGVLPPLPAEVFPVAAIVPAAAAILLTLVIAALTAPGGRR